MACSSPLAVADLAHESQDGVIRLVLQLPDELGKQPWTLPDDGLQIRESTPVIVSSRSSGRTVAESVVLRVGPSIQPLPQRLWTDPRFPDYGRAVVIAATPAMNLTPGEIVNIKFLPDN